MAKFITNGIGFNSINDDDIIPEGWSEVAEAKAAAADPNLVGDAEAVAAVEATETPAAPVEASTDSLETADATPTTKTK